MITRIRPSAVVLCFTVLTCLPILVGAAPGAVRQGPTGNSANMKANRPLDSDLTSRVRRRLVANATLKSYPIDAIVDGGGATLTGSVATASQKSQAGKLAKITGVIKVNNDIVVDPTLPPAGKSAAQRTKASAADAAAKTKEAFEAAGETTKDAVATAGEKTALAAQKTENTVEHAGEATKDAMRTTGGAINDTWITSKVKANFVGEDLLSHSDISVSTSGHVVTLKGTVKTAAGKSRAEEIAQMVEGVSRVVNEIVVTP